MTANPDSILDSVKQVLGLDSEDTTFDLDVTMHINSAFFNLQQLGVGPTTGFAIVDRSLLWTDYTSDISKLMAVKSYLGLKVKMIFDPSDNRFTISSMQEMIKELEWRLNVQAESLTKPAAPTEDNTVPYST